MIYFLIGILVGLVIVFVVKFVESRILILMHKRKIIKTLGYEKIDKSEMCTNHKWESFSGYSINDTGASESEKLVCRNCRMIQGSNFKLNKKFFNRLKTEKLLKQKISDSMNHIKSLALQKKEDLLKQEFDKTLKEGTSPSFIWERAIESYKQIDDNVVDFINNEVDISTNDLVEKFIDDLD